MKKEKKVIEIIESYKDIEVPYHVWRLFSEQAKYISLMGSQASFGEDYASIDELRAAIEWYADQLGGTITWRNSKKSKGPKNA